MIYLNPPVDLADVMKNIPLGYIGPTSGGWVNNCTTTAPEVNIDSLVETMREFKAKQKQIDDDMLGALYQHIAASGEKMHVWAERFGINFVTFVEILSGRQPVSWDFWEGLRRVFEPMRPKPEKSS